jgi:hypothetical protein
MNASLPWWATCLNLGALSCLLGSASNFAARPSSLHEWLAVILPLALAAALVCLSTTGWRR